MIKRITTPIKEPFWSAGTKYGWEGSPTGIGLNIVYFRDMEDDDILEIPIILSRKQKLYRIYRGKAKELFRKYNSSFDAGRNVRLVIIPLYEFECMDKEEMPKAFKDAVKSVEPEEPAKLDL